MRSVFGISMLFLLVGFPVRAAVDIDAGVQPGSIAFSENQLYAGEQVRMYATIVNAGEKDVRGVAQFYQGAIALGEPRPFSAKAQSVPAFIWTDWRPSEGTYNISVSIVGSEPDDQNMSNNMGVTSLMTITKRPPPPPPPPPAPVAVSAPNQADTLAPPSATNAKTVPSASASQSQPKHFYELFRETAQKTPKQSTKKSSGKVTDTEIGAAGVQSPSGGEAVNNEPVADTRFQAETEANDTVDPSKPVPFPKVEPIAPGAIPREKNRGSGIILALAASAAASMLIGGVLWRIAKDK